MNHQYNEPQKASPPHPFSVSAYLRSSLLLAIGFTFHAHAAAPLADAVEQRDATAVRTLLAASAIDAPQPDGTGGGLRLLPNSYTLLSMKRLPLE